MSMVERLARRWDDAFAGQEYPEDDPKRHDYAKSDACWWLLVIADELEGDDTAPMNATFSATWLRNQAQEPTR